MKLKTMPHHTTNRNANRTYTAGLHDESNLIIGVVTASTEERANKLASQIVLEHNTHAALLDALQALLGNHTRLVASGDCGNWDVETEPEVVQARAAIAAATGGSK